MKSCIIIKRGPEIRIASETGAVDSVTVAFVKADAGIRSALSANWAPCLVCLKARASDYFCAVSRDPKDFAKDIDLSDLPEGHRAISAAIIGVCLDCLLSSDERLAEAALKASPK